MFLRLLSMAAPGAGRSVPARLLRERLYLTTSRGKLLRGLPTEFVHTHRERLAHVASRQQLDGAASGDQTGGNECFGRDDRSGLEALGQRVDVHHFVLNPEGVMETALRDAAVKRHLAAFEPALELEAGTRLRALVPPPGGVPVAGALSAAD